MLNARTHVLRSVAKSMDLSPQRELRHTKCWCFFISFENNCNFPRYAHILFSCFEIARNGSFFPVMTEPPFGFPHIYGPKTHKKLWDDHFFLNLWIWFFRTRPPPNGFQKGSTVDVKTIRNICFEKVFECIKQFWFENEFESLKNNICFIFDKNQKCVFLSNIVCWKIKSPFKSLHGYKHKIFCICKQTIFWLSKKWDNFDYLFYGGLIYPFFEI